MDGKIERTETGNGSPQLVERLWDVSSLVGKTARLEIVDSTTSDERGYVMVDDIRFDNMKRVNFKLVSTFHQRVKAVLSKTVTSPKTTGGILQFYALVPPSIETQKLVSCSVQCHEFPDLQTFSAKDAFGADKSYLGIKIPMSPQPITIDIIYVLDLYKTILRSGISMEISSATPETTDLRETKVFDYNDAGFKAILKTHELTKGLGETNFDFAYRAYSRLSDDLARRYQKDFPFVGMEGFKASFNCKQKFHDGQCGVCALLFVSALRANGVPSRLMVGRWAKNTEGDYAQFHVRSDFYEPSIGWIPVDQGSGFCAIRDRGNIDMHFGTESGEFITMHLNSEISPEGTKIYRPISQFEVFEYKGKSPFVPTISEQWKVTKLS